METKLALERLETAKREIAAAEADLAKALQTIQNQPRAEKTTISMVLEHAFEKLRSARLALAALDAMVVDDE